MISDMSQDGMYNLREDYQLVDITNAKFEESITEDLFEERET